MITVRIEEKDAFRVCGKKIWIGGQDNEAFGAFWAESNQSGFTGRLKALEKPNVMERALLGVSRVEDDPANRAFWFYIACETDAEADGLECFTVPASKWAVFSNRGEDPGAALVEAELYCHLTWLGGSGFTHANAPELEVYPERDGALVEYWLPIC